MVKEPNTSQGTSNEHDSEPWHAFERDPEPWETIDRDRGFLTEDDREYLAGKRELEGQHERNTRYRIRQRTIQGFQDVAFIKKHLPRRAQQDIEQLSRSEELQSRQLRVSNLAMTYQLLFFDDGVTDMIEEFEKLLELMLFETHPYEELPESEIRRKREVSVNIEINDKTDNLEDIGERIRQGVADITDAIDYLAHDDDELVEEAKHILREAGVLEQLTEDHDSSSDE